MYITNPEKAYTYLRSVWPSEISLREKVLLIYLDANKKVMGYECVFMGGRSSVAMDLKILFQYAVRECAHSILVAHNHPSGILTPSKNDLDVTRDLHDGGRILGLEVAHMIITRTDYHVLSFFE